MFGGLVNLLGGPLIKAVMGPIDTYFKQKGMSQRSLDKIRGEVEQELYGQLEHMAEHQASAIKAEVTSGWFLAGNWRALVGLAFATILLFYAIWVPVTVAYWGWPAPRVGDILLGNVFDILKMSVGGYVGIAALDKVINSRNRGRVR